jgi:hypothetical protein
MSGLLIGISNHVGATIYGGGVGCITLPPVATSATAILPNSFTANWLPYSGADAYYLDVSTDPLFATYVLFNEQILAPSTSYNVTGLTLGQTYYYRVRAEGNIPTIITAPELTPSGTQSVGVTITCSTGDWNNQGTIFNYRWKRNGNTIAGVISNTYTLQTIDIGATITCQVRNTNGFCFSEYVTTSNSVVVGSAIIMEWGTETVTNWGDSSSENWG